ncbi:hypothetical protein B9Q11_04040 [Candidatus Marsarchaeota G2 archaeon ECH_B_SAG-F08]|jgi:adenylate kinase|uniref:Adenylate kinase n=2 Tax=Candidatus Marsarchaeota TaxID=1978152 RepID=A0A2R6AK89_9ARCH|nr:MAG: hypothetical protein B9Q02_00965 [Candidatus Marsarchaeota G1 archaeon BE_D]PSN97500.1 MAG: hypothetical protein B9Q11_04040 [Candidatus Marsarchaeota G2 archaeon ECH_B_SAG-F08]
MSVDEVKLSRKGKLIVVAGINGVGKTTVLNSVKQLTKEIEVVNYGDEMFSIASQRGWVQNRDQIRKLPLERQLLLQKEAAQNLSLKAKEKNIIVDTHVLIPTPSGAWPGLPKWVVESLAPDIIVILEAPPDVIFMRRNLDKLRERKDQSSIEEIRTFMELIRAAAIASAVLVGAAVVIVQNIEGDPSFAAKEIVKLFSS